MTITSEADEKVRPELDGVPETLLWTLYNRACEARRPDAVLHDPMAVELMDALDYPFEERLGAPSALFSQVQGLRSLTYDLAVRRYIGQNPEATVVALGEGLETSFWRVDNGRLKWLSVELPEGAELRSRLLPAHSRARVRAGSATDLGWLDEVADPHKGVIVTAQGLMMYLRPGEVRSILAACAERFPGGAMVLDSMAPWVTRLTRKGLVRMNDLPVPPMNWSMAGEHRDLLRTAHPGITGVRALTMPPGRGLRGSLIHHQHRIPVFRSISPAVTQLGFAD
ncbi:class I SAM-dependent methyltransferase [Streptomyces sp. NPDC050738]|uniref:class I SAM-dependent methyltransferase n=1 Tax=Streptomyces sp. NPDC050738 TaxID=3154744 RepID=UPI00343E2E4C